MKAEEAIHKEMDEKYIKDMAIAGLSEYSLSKLLAWMFYRGDDRPMAQTFFTKGAEREIAKRFESYASDPQSHESVSDEEIEKMAKDTGLTLLQSLYNGCGAEFDDEEVANLLIWETLKCFVTVDLKDKLSGLRDRDNSKESKWISVEEINKEFPLTTKYGKDMVGISTVNQHKRDAIDWYKSQLRKKKEEKCDQCNKKRPCMCNSDATM